jgi:predicted adenine nucleotide alpha hydrolase (AANH) superfamily ATPase
MMKLLLHACCAPCSTGCAAALREEGILPELFWYNPNIHPFTEYRARRDCLSGFASEEDLLLIAEDEYGLRKFIAGLAPDWESRAGGGRCAFCYRLRLEKAAKTSAEKGYEAFSTTLLISPYQNHGLLKEIGEELAGRYGVKFLYRDFRPWFRVGQAGAKKRGYYMQKYCGCVFSEEERYLPAAPQGKQP